MDAPGPLRPPPWLPIGVALVAGAVACVALALAALRIAWPFELEWMEGAMVDHSARILEGHPLYSAPSLEHVPYLYTPLYFMVGAVSAQLFGLDFFALRIVNFLPMVGACALLALAVRREGASRTAALAAAALPLCGYGYVDGWFDLARNDGLLFLFLMAAVYLARHQPLVHLWTVGVAATLAFLSKQSALMFVPAVCLAAGFLDWRRGLLCAGWSALGIGMAVMGWHQATDGWFTFYVFEMPADHGVSEQIQFFFTRWRLGILPLLPSVVLAFGALAIVWRSGVSRGRLFFWATVCCALWGMTWLSRRHAGGYLNSFIPALLAAGFLAGFTVQHRRLAAVLVLAQILCLGSFLTRPARFLPGEQQWQAQVELREWLRGIEGDVLLLFHGHLAAREGKAATAHAQAVFDLLQFNNGSSEQLGILHRDLLKAAESRRYAAVVLDEKHLAVSMSLLDTLLRDYQRVPPPVSSPADLQPVAGMRQAWPAAFFIRK